MPDGRGRFSYPRFGGFSGYGADLGNPAGGAGGQALQRMTQAGAPRQQRADPLWSEIESTFQDILGEYANLDLNMPIQPPDMEDPQDQIRYLKDLEALGMSGAPSAHMMGQNIRGALDLMKQQEKMMKERADLIIKVLPALEDSPGIKALFSAQLLNMIMPGQFDIGEKPGLEWGPPDPTVTRLTPETATEGELYQGISSMALPKAIELATAKDKEGLRDYLDLLLEQLVAGNIDEGVAIAIVNEIHADAIGRVKAGEPIY